MMGNINQSEFETVIELIIAVLFMCFGAYAMSQMVLNLSARTDTLSNSDKIEVTRSTHYAEDPFYFTAYQAYMFSWHMDELSYEDLYYTSIPGGTGSPEYIDSGSNGHVKLSTFVQDDHGQSTDELLNQFYVWRNQMITGVGKGEERSVKKTIQKSVPSGVSLEKFYKGNYPNVTKPLLYHLELTGDLQTSDDLGDNNPNAGGRKFKWILVPREKNVS